MVEHKLTEKKFNPNTAIKNGPITIDLLNDCALIDDWKFHLSPRETDILIMLNTNAFLGPKDISRIILETLQEVVKPSTVGFYLSRLSHKLPSDIFEKGSNRKTRIRKI